MQRCQAQPSTLAIAALSPAWASEIASWTPTRPRATRPLRKLGPERLGLGLADVDREDLAAAGLMHAMGDDERLGDHAAAVADLLDLGVEEQIRVAALERAVPERLDVLIQRRADPAHLRARDPQPERLDQLVDPAGRNAAHIGLLDNRQQRLLGTPARLQKAREVAALPQLRDLQLDLAGPGVPTAGPIAIAVRRAVIGPALPVTRRRSAPTPPPPSSPPRSP